MSLKKHLQTCWDLFLSKHPLSIVGPLVKKRPHVRLEANEGHFFRSLHGAVCAFLPSIHTQCRCQRGKVSGWVVVSLGLGARFNMYVNIGACLNPVTVVKSDHIFMKGKLVQLHSPLLTVFLAGHNVYMV